jgi:hypothetical protein
MPLPAPESRLADAGAITSVPMTRRHRRAMFRQLRGAVPGYAPISNDTNDPDTQVQGLRKRLLRDIPAPDPTFLAEFKAFVHGYVQRFASPRERMDLETWLAGTTYTEARKNELREADAENRGTYPDSRCRHSEKSFGQTESYAEYKYLRWINSRPDRVKCWMGPLMKMVEQLVFAENEFIKHTPVQDRPAKLAGLMKDGLRYFLTDFTAFESHFGPAFMKACECVLYRHVLEHVCTPEELDALEKTLTGTNNLRTRLGVKASVDGRRMSGDMCTSLGNGFTNLMLALFIAHKKGVSIDGFVEGDDGIFASDGALLEEDYTKLGWTIKLREVSSPCEMLPIDDGEVGQFGKSIGAFCGICCSQDGQIIRDPRAFLSTFGWTSNYVHAGERVMDELQRAKALSAAYETPSCPIVSIAARRALKETLGVQPRFVLDTYKAHACPKDERGIPPFAPTVATRLLFEAQFGVSVAAQLEIEARLMDGRKDILELLGSGEHMLHYEARYVERQP